MQKKHEKAEYPGSAPREFCKSRKMPKEYFFVDLLTGAFNNRGKKRHIKPLLLPTVSISKKSKEMGPGDPTSQSSENII